MHLEGVGSVLERICFAQRSCRQLPWLSHWCEASPDAIGNRRSENESAALDAHNNVDPLILKRHRETVDCHSKPNRFLQQRRDVVEENSCFRKVGYVANLCFEMFHVGLLENASGHLILNPD